VSLKALATNALLAVLSLGAALAAAEAILRYGMSLERLVPNAPETPALNERRNALRFLEKSREKGSVSSSGHDRWLGWDTGHPATRVRDRARIPPATGLRAVALGDSFVWGNEVAGDENFAALLNRANNGLEVLNMGVPGYGIDQAILKYERHGADYRPDVVILGIYVSDYERSTVALTAAPKPLFVLLDDQLVLTGSPVPPPGAVLDRIEQSLSGVFYLREFVTSRLPGARQTPDEFFDTSDRIIGRLLERLRNGLEPGQRLLIVHIPRGESFATPDPFHQQMSEHLTDLYRTLGLSVVDLEEIFVAGAAGRPVAERFYRVRQSGSVGHLNPAGHAAAAEAIARKLSL
jgi:lysophospholipase L1-like esterase